MSTLVKERLTAAEYLAFERRADYDRGTKFAHYRTLPSLRECVFVSAGRVHVEDWVRQPEDRWLLTESDNPAAILDLDAIGCKLDLATAYERVVVGTPGLTV